VLCSLKNKDRLSFLDLTKKRWKNLGNYSKFFKYQYYHWLNITSYLLWYWKYRIERTHYKSLGKLWTDRFFYNATEVAIQIQFWRKWSSSLPPTIPRSHSRTQPKLEEVVSATPPKKPKDNQRRNDETRSDKIKLYAIGSGFRGFVRSRVSGINLSSVLRWEGSVVKILALSYYWEKRYQNIIP